MSYPVSTGPAVESKSTAFDAPTNTGNFLNGADWNRLAGLVNAMRGQLVGTYRGFVERRSSGTMTAVVVHTAMALVDGYRKTVASARLLIPGTTGSTYVWIRGNTGATAMTVRTAASEPSPYQTTTRDFPLARVTRSGGAMTITSYRPDWVLQHRI